MLDNIYTLKESRLKAALSKVQTKLDYLAENQNQLSDQDYNSWNNWHDLKDRIKNRLFDNWSDHMDWHWGEFGWNSY